MIIPAPTPPKLIRAIQELTTHLHAWSSVEPENCADPACVLLRAYHAAIARAEAADHERDRLREALNTPELHDFAKAVALEAAHQRERWGSEHDAGKDPADWFWLLGYLAGKALWSATHGDREKAMHHTISSAAALANWHAALSGTSTRMRPGIEEPRP